MFQEEHWIKHALQLLIALQLDDGGWWWVVLVHKKGLERFPQCSIRNVVQITSWLSIECSLWNTVEIFL